MRPMTRALLAVAGTGLLTAVTLWMLRRGNQGTATATVLSFSVSVLALTVAIISVRWQGVTDEHKALAESARALARDVRIREADQQQKFLADTGQPRPANVGFKQPALVRWRSDGGRRYGSMDDIKIFYAGLRHGRLVILGPAGAGKTVLANQLLLDIIALFPAGSSLPSNPFQVPVRISLASFNPGDHLDNTPSAQTRFRLDEWIVSYLADVHGLAPWTARTLLKQGWILPILDGLDEMDSTSQNPDRAAAVIRSLNHPTDGTLRPVVITCRTERYEQLATSHYAAGRQPVLEDATAVEIEPLAPAQINEYLTYRFPDPANPRRVQERWQPVLTNVTDQLRGPLATALSSPLRLFLAVTAYHSPDTTPAELIQLPADDLDRYLLDQLIPAVTAQHPKPNGETYHPGNVTRWLTTFAGYLETERTIHGDSAASDIDLHNIWTLAGRRIPLFAASLRALLVAVPLIVLAVYYQQLVPALSDPTLPAFYPIPWRLLFVGVVILVAAAALSAEQTGAELRRLDRSRLRTANARLKVAIGLGVGLGLGLGLGIGLTGGILAGLGLGLAVGLAIGIPFWQRYRRANKHVVGLIVGLAVVAGPDLFIGYSLWGVGATWLAPTFGIIFGLTAGLTGGLGAGLAWGLTQRPAAISKPSQLVTQGVFYELTLTIAITLSFGIVFSIQWLAGFVSSVWPVSSAATPGTVLENVSKFYGPSLVLFYVPKALLLGLACGIAVNATSPWLRYLIASRILARRHLLPENPAAFLDWAYNAGLMRLSGIHVQFRHDELQKHLNATQQRRIRYSAAEAASASMNPGPRRQQIGSVGVRATGTALLGSASDGVSIRARLALPGALLGVLILATAAAPGVITPTIGNKVADQSPAVPPAPAGTGPDATVIAFFDAINQRDWSRVWKLGAKNLGTPYARMVHGFANTSQDDLTITSTRGNTVSVFLVALEAHNQAQVYRGAYVVDHGVITHGIQSLEATAPSEGAIFGGVAGNWHDHGGDLTISSHGLGIAQFRVYQWCNTNPSPPCDSMEINYIYGGGVTVFQLTRESGNQAEGFILGGSVPRSNGRVTITFKSLGDAITMTTGNSEYPAVYCGPYSLPYYCGA
jgi:hypothetical protein